MQTTLFHRDEFQQAPQTLTIHTVKVGTVFEYKPAGAREAVPVEVLRITVTEDDGNGITRTIHGRRWDNQRTVKLTSSRRMGRAWPEGIVPKREVDRREGVRIRELLESLPTFDAPKDYAPEIGDVVDSHDDNLAALVAAANEQGVDLR